MRDSGSRDSSSNLLRATRFSGHIFARLFFLRDQRCQYCAKEYRPKHTGTADTDLPDSQPDPFYQATGGCSGKHPGSATNKCRHPGGKPDAPVKEKTASQCRQGGQEQRCPDPPRRQDCCKHKGHEGYENKAGGKRDGQGCRPRPPCGKIHTGVFSSPIRYPNRFRASGRPYTSRGSPHAAAAGPWRC